MREQYCLRLYKMVGVDPAFPKQDYWRTCKKTAGHKGKCGPGERVEVKARR